MPKKKICDTRFPAVRIAKNSAVKDKPTPIFAKAIFNYVELEKLTGFYERRQNIIEDFMENNGQNGDEKEYLLQINAKVKEPFRYEWTEGWSCG